ncbi:hypothetical protein DFH09DRAFT_1097392 [Mycena vulgaris]|nr:hypothetical protein DFH09DRAFT_1097392 [Mycena vulgaris]
MPCELPVFTNTNYVSDHDHDTNKRKFWFLVLALGLFTLNDADPLCAPDDIIILYTKSQAQRLWDLNCQKRHSHDDGDDTGAHVISDDDDDRVADITSPTPSPAPSRARRSVATNSAARPNPTPRAPTSSTTKCVPSSNASTAAIKTRAGASSVTAGRAPVKSIAAKRISSAPVQAKSAGRATVKAKRSRTARAPPGKRDASAAVMREGSTIVKREGSTAVQAKREGSAPVKTEPRSPRKLPLDNRERKLPLFRGDSDGGDAQPHPQRLRHPPRGAGHAHRSRIQARKTPGIALALTTPLHAPRLPRPLALSQHELRVVNLHSDDGGVFHLRRAMRPARRHPSIGCRHCFKRKWLRETAVDEMGPKDSVQVVDCEDVVKFCAGKGGKMAK